jgi:hypothetical protein
MGPQGQNSTPMTISIGHADRTKKLGGVVRKVVLEISVHRVQRHLERLEEAGSLASQYRPKQCKSLGMTGIRKAWEDWGTS